MTADPATFRFVSTNRRVREDRRFVAGQRPLRRRRRRSRACCMSRSCRRSIPAARIVSIDASAALAMPGVHYVLTGDELAAATDPLMNGLDTPKVQRHPLAVGTDALRRRMGGRGGRRQPRAWPRTPAEKVRGRCTSRCPSSSTRSRRSSRTARRCIPAHGSNVLLDRTFVWGEVEKHFAESPRQLAFRVTWGRNSTVPIETFGVAASWDPWRDMLDVWASIQMPKYPDQIARALRIPANNVRVHQDVDVGGSYGVKRGIKQTVLVAHLARRLGRPVRLIEDRLENMRGGDAHGPERIFDVEVAFNNDGIVKSMKIRALDNAGAYAGRAPFQLGKPIGAIVGPYKIESVQYRAQSVTSPTRRCRKRCAVLVRRRPIMRSRPRSTRSPQPRPRAHRSPPPQLHPQGAVSVPDPERQHLRQRRLSHGGRQGVRAYRFRRNGAGARSACAPPGLLAGIGIAACLEPAAAIPSFEPLLNEKNTTTTWMDSCRINRRRARLRHGNDPQHLVRAGARDPGVDRDRRSAADRSRPDPRGAAGLAGLPAVELAGRQPDGDHARRRRVSRRAETEDKADADRSASVRPRRGQGCLRLGRRRRSQKRQAARLDRHRQYRAIAIFTCCPRAWSPASSSRM